MSADDQEIWRQTCRRRGDSFERVAQFNKEFAVKPVDFAQRVALIGENSVRDFAFALHQLPRLVIVDHVNEGDARAELPSQQRGSPYCAIGSSGEVRGNKYLLHDQLISRFARVRSTENVE